MDVTKLHLHSSKVRVPKGAEVRTTHSKGDHIRGRTSTVTVRSVDQGWVDFVGTLEDVYTGNARRHCCDVRNTGLDMTREECEDLYGALELLEAAVSAEERQEIIDGCDRLVLGEGSRIYAHLRKPTITWTGAGGYWFWTAADNCEVVA